MPSNCPEKQLLQLSNKYASESPTFKFCPGIDPDEYEKMREIIRFDIVSVRKTQEPFLCIDSVSCSIWFELGANCRLNRREAGAVMCPSCVRLKYDLQHQVNRTSSESPSKKIKRQASSSHARSSYMSPSSQHKRKSNQQNERKNLMKKLSRFQEAEVPLDDEQNDEVSSITSFIQNNHQEELEKLYHEGMINITTKFIVTLYNCRS